MHFHRTLFLSASVAAILSATGGSGHAADPYMLPGPATLPAVSAPNAKLGIFGGALDGYGAFGVNGSLAVPLHGQWGAQIDGLFGTANSDAFYGVGGHLFWRDPSVGLIGAYASYVGWGEGFTTTGGGIGPFYDLGGASVGKVGAEGEAYFGRMSLEAVGAYQFGSFTGFSGRAALAYYPTDDFRLDIGVNYLEGPGASITAGGEWQFTGTGTSLFVDGSYASGDAWSAVGGIRMYFGGEQKSLIRRHREDDPDNLLPGDLYQGSGDAYCTEGGRLELDDGILVCVPPIT